METFKFSFFLLLIKKILRTEKLTKSNRSFWKLEEEEKKLVDTPNSSFIFIFINRTVSNENNVFLLLRCYLRDLA